MRWWTIFKSKIIRFLAKSLSKLHESPLSKFISQSFNCRHCIVFPHFLFQMNSLFFLAVIVPYLTLFRMGIFGTAYGCGRAKRTPLPKVCYTYPTIMKLGTVILYLKKIQNIWITRHTPVLLLTSAFFHWN